jgi:PAS domain S-box-containing protein
MLSSHDAMGLMDSSGRFLHVNVAWSKLSGYELSDLEGCSLSVLEGAETDPSMVQLYRKAMQEQRAVEVNLIHYRRNGEKYLDQMTVVPIQGGYLQPSKFFLAFTETI